MAADKQTWFQDWVTQRQPPSAINAMQNQVPHSGMVWKSAWFLLNCLSLQRLIYLYQGCEVLTGQQHGATLQTATAHCFLWSVHMCRDAALTDTRTTNTAATCLKKPSALWQLSVLASRFSESSIWILFSVIASSYFSYLSVSKGRRSFHAEGSQPQYPLTLYLKNPKCWQEPDWNHWAQMSLNFLILCFWRAIWPLRQDNSKILSARHWRWQTDWLRPPLNELLQLSFCVSVLFGPANKT